MNKDKKGQTTLIERMGFNDKDFKTSKHDEICLWLAKKENIVKMIFDLKLSNCFVIKKYDCTFKEVIWDCENHKVVTEVVRRNKYSGQVEEEKEPDEQIISGCKFWYNKFINVDFKERFSLLFEYVITAQSNFVVGFIDLVVSFNVIKSRGFESYEHVGEVLNIEVKSVMPTFGEIVREINYYKKFHKGIYIVVAPECSFEQELKDQGIYFYKYNL